MQPFDDLGGEFQARLREIVSTTRQTADGSSTVTFSTSRIECDYTPGVIKKLGLGQLVAVPNVQTLGTNNVYSLYEIADVYPMHYSMRARAIHEITDEDISGSMERNQALR